jgi:hypothetical protein
MNHKLSVSFSSVYQDADKMYMYVYVNSNINPFSYLYLRTHSFITSKKSDRYYGVLFAYIEERVLE